MSRCACGSKVCVGDELGDLFHGPTGPNVVIAIERKCRPVEVRDVVQQRWTLNVLLPRLINLGIDLKIRRVVVHGKRLEALGAPLFIYPVPLPIIVNPTTSYTYEAIYVRGRGDSAGERSQDRQGRSRRYRWLLDQTVHIHVVQTG